jgi:hypothetical protein
MYLCRKKACASTHVQNAEVNIFGRIQHKFITILLVVHSKRGYLCTCGEERHFKSKIIKSDVPRLSLEGLYKIPFIGLMDWRGKFEKPIIADAEAGTPEMQACA